jgi:heme/copper-type cytochrome/quinol oxidase subunit 2
MERIKNGYAKFVIGLLSLSTMALADDGGALSDSGTSAKDALSSTITSFLWIMPLIVIGVAGGFMGFAYVKIKKDEKGQDAQILTHTQMAMRLVGAAIVGVIVVYITLGIFGKAFLGMSLSDTWNYFVLQPFDGLLGVSASTK